METLIKVSECIVLTSNSLGAAVKFGKKSLLLSWKFHEVNTTLVVFIPNFTASYAITYVIIQVTITNWH